MTAAVREVLWRATMLRARTADNGLQVVDDEHPLRDVETVQQPLVRLALRVRQVGLEALS